MQARVCAIELGDVIPQLSHAAWDGEVFTSNVKTSAEYFADLGAMFTARVRAGAYAFDGDRAIGASEYEDYTQYRGRILSAKPTSIATELHRLHCSAIELFDKYIVENSAKPANGCGVAIEPTWRNNNLATQLCEQRLTCAKKAGFTHLFVETTGYSCKLMKKLNGCILAEYNYSFPCEWKFTAWVIKL